MQGPQEFEHLDGGEPAPLATHLRRPAVLLVIIVLAVLAGAGLVVARPWAPAPDAATASSSAAPTTAWTVTLVSTGSAGTVVPSGDAGAPPVARIDLRIDLRGPKGTRAHVLGMSGPGLSAPTSTVPDVGAGDAAIGLLGATVRCSDVRADAGYGVDVEVTEPGGAAGPTRVTRPLQGDLSADWAALLASACTPTPAG